MQRKISFSIGEYYHIYNRGTDKREIFADIHDHRRFSALLYACNSAIPVNISEHLQKGRSFLELFDIERGDSLVDVVVYCLMPNHFHLLVRERTEGGIVKFMGKLSTAYSMYFNSRNDRSGGLFEGRFKAKHIESDNYLKYLYAYIHLNPVKIIDPKWKEEGIKDRITALDFLKNYEYSSYLDWQGIVRPETRILNREAGPEYFTSVKDFDSFVREWLDFRPEI